MASCQRVGEVETGTVGRDWPGPRDCAEKYASGPLDAYFSAQSRGPGQSGPTVPVSTSPTRW
jgi:hypothetical protein